MNLILDAGNTLVKIAVYESGSCIFYDKIESRFFSDEIEKIFKKYPKIKHAIASSVGFLDKTALNLLSDRCGLHVLSHNSKTPLKNKYATPHTLGVDRIALAVAAYYIYPKKNALIIDAGTCITYDMLDSKGTYLGGAISPGMYMRYKALHNQTSKLPLLQATDFLDFIGNSTEESMHSGVINGICNEIDGVISQYSLRFKDLTVILTGGDAQFLSKRLKNTIFANSKFLLEGLNYLLENNKD